MEENLNGGHSVVEVIAENLAAATVGESVEHVQEYASYFIQNFELYGMRLLTAIGLLIIGIIVIKIILKLTKKVMKKREVDAAISSFVTSLLKAALWVLLVITTLSQIGVQTTSFIAVIGAAGLALGLALQGSLSNFAAGFLIILMRPFKVGDVVDTGGNLGVIDGISMFSTEMKTFDNRRIFIPNAQIMGSIITNVTAENTRRVDFLFSVAHSNDIQKVKDIILEIINKHDLTMKEPEPFVRMSNLTNISMDFTVRTWSKTSDYWSVFFDINEQVKEAFNKNNIAAPTPGILVTNKN